MDLIISVSCMQSALRAVTNLYNLIDVVLGGTAGAYTNHMIFTSISTSVLLQHFNISLANWLLKVLLL